MSREAPYEPNETCDVCGKAGAFDVMGDMYCSDCLSFCEVETEELLDDLFERMEDAMAMLREATPEGRVFYIASMRRLLDELEAI